ncbi:MAG TPA: LPS export ABC transporter periplasmic protein LptC [Terriglobales bacterium]|nr:LPS export ABC transporter periplasmic protein LptC [Terriglobales bacterium]
MPLSISRLRRWFGLGAVAVAVIVACTYYYARWRLRETAQALPGKMGLEIQQTANGFTISKSQQGRTVFTIRANNAVQYRQGGQAVLHNVAITVYGKQADRFDQIYGSEFLYDQQTGDVVGKGEVQIDLQSNPGGTLQPDQSPPKELKDAVHIKTTGLIFNQKTGNAYTPERVDFSVPQANGTSIGATYNAKEGMLDLHSQVHVVLTGTTAGTLDATHGVIRRDPRQIDLDSPRLVHDPETYESDHATVYLRPDNSVDHMVGTGHVKIHMEGDSPLDARSDRADMLMVADPNRASTSAATKEAPAQLHSVSHPEDKRADASRGAINPNSLSQPAPRNLLRMAILSSNVHVESHGDQLSEGDAGRATFWFTGKNVLTTARAEQNVRIVAHHVGGSKAAGTTAQKSPSSQTSSPQDIIINAPVIDFAIVNEGRTLKSAVTSGPPKVTILPSEGATGQQTVITARKFFAHFDDQSRLNAVHGAPDAKIVNSAPGETDRVSTSNMLDVAFVPAGGIQSVLQTGNVAYVDADRKAWGDRAKYTPNDQMLYLDSSPRFEQGGMTTTARTMRLDRAKGDAFAEGNVKSTYSELKPQPNGALLASSDPIHVTSITMVSHRDPGIATYTGNARLWQNSSVVQAPIIQFDRDKRTVVAHGTPDYRVSTVFIQTDNKGKQTPVHIVSDNLQYADNERLAHFTGSVIARSEDATLTGDQADVYLLPQSSGSTEKESTSAAPHPGGSSVRVSSTGAQQQILAARPAPEARKTPDGNSAGNRIDKIIADGHVVVVQPTRRAVGTHLLYTASDDRFVLTGGSPSIFDAEHGKVTGDSLTFYKRDDRVLVDGEANSPAFSETRVAR